jgi:molybdenum-dependent DNA-binding transcriptional regulator ModE
MLWFDMPRKVKPKVLKNLEEKLLEALADSVSVKEASSRIGISYKTAYNTLYRMRRKYTKARAYVNKIDAQKRRNKLLRMVLTSRIGEEEEVEVEEEEW